MQIKNYALRPLAVLTTFTAAAVVAACGSGLGPEDLDRIEFAAGNGRIATVGTAVDVAPAVRALSVDGLPIPGVNVTFTVESGGGTVTGGSVTTDEEGVAAVGSWTLGPTAGQNTLTASSGSQTLTFEAVGLVAEAAVVTDVLGDNQTATAGRPLPIAPSVLVTDEFGNVVEGQTVMFAIVGLEGSIDPDSSVTDVDGIAVAGDWTLGPTPGTNQLTASAGTGTFTFTADGIPGPVTIAVAAGDSQVGVAGKPLTLDPEALVTDAQGLPVANADVAFTVFLGAGSVSADTAQTDANGIASTTWTLGTLVGSNSLTASVADIGSAQFVATAGPDVADTLIVLRGDNQSAAVNTDAPFPPTVIVHDQYGNAVPGVTVTFAVTGGGGSLTDPVAVSDSNGIASPTAWTMGPSTGPNTVDATFSGSAPLTFTATGLSEVFNLEMVRFGGGGQAVNNGIDVAVAKWENFIIGDLPDISFVSNPLAENTCFNGQPEVNDVVDDLRIFMRIEPIDGPGSILGAAGPCVIRDSADGGLTVIGSMRFDSDDLANLANNGILIDVMVHEIGHVVGIGTLWDDFGYLENPSLPSNQGADTHFTGPLAIAAFDSIGGASFQASKVPVESTQGGAGTRDAHWRESVMQNENMTGFVDQGSNPFSLVSMESLADLGYVVNLAQAEDFTITTAAPAQSDTRSFKFELINDVELGPIYVVRRDGVITRAYRVP